MNVSDLTSTLREMIATRLADQVTGITVSDRHAKRWTDSWQKGYAGVGIGALLYIESAATTGRHILTVTVAVQIEENVAQNLSNVGTGTDSYSWAEEIWAALDQWAPSEAWTAFDSPSIAQVVDEAGTTGWVFSATTRTAYGIEADS